MIYHLALRSSWQMITTSHAYLTANYFGTIVAVFHTDVIQPYALRTPEVILGNGRRQVLHFSLLHGRVFFTTHMFSRKLWLFPSFAMSKYPG